MADPAPVPLVALLTAVDDPRQPQARRRSLEAILLIATPAVICGTRQGSRWRRQKARMASPCSASWNSGPPWPA